MLYAVLCIDLEAIPNAENLAVGHMAGGMAFAPFGIHAVMCASSTMHNWIASLMHCDQFAARRAVTVFQHKADHIFRCAANLQQNRSCTLL